jgi:hypothetical protein
MTQFSNRSQCRAPAILAEALCILCTPGGDICRRDTRGLIHVDHRIGDRENGGDLFVECEYSTTADKIAVPHTMMLMIKGT